MAAMSPPISGVDVPGPYSIGSDEWPGLSRLIEECGELLQVAGKIIGSGGSARHYDGTDLGAALAEEVADVLAAVMYARAHMTGLVPHRDDISRRVQAKFEQYQRWDHAGRRAASGGAP